MSSTGARKKRTPFDIAIESLRDTNSADIERMKMFSAESSPISGQVGGASTNSATPGGSFLNIAGQTPMLGAIAFNPVDVAINSSGRIDITPGATAPSDYSSYVLMVGAGTPDDLNFIDGAANNGQLLYLQGTATQILTIKHATIGVASNIVGTTTVTVTTSTAHGLTTGNKVDISSTTNFNIQNASITVTGGTTFTYSATGSATPESGFFQNGNVVTSDGSDIILDGTKATNAVPWIALLFDPTVIAGGAWRVQFGAGATGGGLTEPIILGINTLTPQTSPTVTPIAWNTKNPQHIIIDRNITFSFTDLPSTGSYEGILVIIDINGTGGFDTPIWPSSVANPPTVPTTANTRTSVMLYTIDGGTTVTHATSVGSSSSGGTTTLSGLTIDVTKDWDAKGISNFGALSGVTSIDLDGVAATIQGIANLDFFQSNHSINSISGEMDFQVASTDFFRFIAGGNEIARFEDIATVLSLDMKKHAIKNIKDIFFDTAASFSGGAAQPTIGYDLASTEMRLNVPTLNNFSFTVNNVQQMFLDNGNMTFRDGFLAIFNPNTTNAGVNVGLIIGDPSATNNADLWYNSSTNKLRTKENGFNVDVISGGANTTLSNLVSPTNVNQDLLPNQATGGNLGSTTANKEWFNLFTRRVTFPVATSLGSSDYTFGRATTPARVQYNVPTGAIHQFTINGNQEMKLDNVALTLAGVNLAMENNDITDLDIANFTGPTGDVVKGRIATFGDNFQIISDRGPNGGALQFNINASPFMEIIGTSGNESLDMLFNPIKKAERIQLQTSGNTLIDIFNSAGSLIVDVATGENYSFQVNSANTMTIDGTDVNIPLTKFLDISENISSATAGSATLPSNPNGFIKIKVGGIERRVPFYNV